MKIRLIPCFISSSPKLVDTTSRIKDDVVFEQIMQKFGINLDATCPSNFKGTEIVSEGNDFMKLFKEVEQKARDYWLDFEKSHFKKNEYLDKDLQGEFRLIIRDCSYGTFVFLQDDITEFEALRFYLVTDN